MNSVSKITRGLGAALIALGLCAAPASAWVPDLAVKAEKFSFKQLTDIQKQQAKLIKCYVKAGSKCEYNEGDSVSCALATWDTTGAPNPKFQAAVAKCESKLKYAKKTPKALNDASAYTAIHCPGDADAAVSGNQDFAGIAAYQVGNGTRSSQTQIDALAALVRTGVTDSKMMYKDTGVLNKYAAGLFKVMGKCETDAKNKKGNGATTDSNTQCYPGDAGADAAFAAAVTKELGKAQKKLGSRHAFVIGLIDAALGDASQDFWNNSACGDTSPSGAFLDGGVQF
jgi:hypothetical protein